MRIGILTFYESENYGTVLQAFALQHYLESKGQIAELIRIKRSVNAASTHYKSIDTHETQIERARIKLSTLLHNGDCEKKKKGFNEFREEKLRFGKEYYEGDDELYNNPPEYDLYISGGDQIWNPYHKVFSFHYMFDFLPEGSKKASYGSSFGVTDIPDKMIMGKMKHLLSDYRDISVREKSGIEILNRMGLSGKLVLDPVFLIEDTWKKIIESTNVKHKKKYCLVYSLVDYPKGEDNIICSFAKKRGLDVIVLPENRHNHSTFYKKAFDAGPKQFLSLVSNAEHVFTNSYHGLAFSILFHKQFSLLSTVSKESASKRNRLTNILDLLALPDRPVEYLPGWIDYSQVSLFLREKTKASYDYLQAIISCGK